MFRKIFKVIGNRSYSKNHNLKPSFVPLEKQEIINEIAPFPGVSQEKWQNTCSIFRSYGFKTNDIRELVKENKFLIKCASNTLVNNIEFWRSFKFNENDFKELICNHPELLNVIDHDTIYNNIFYIMKYVSTTKNLWRILLNSPNIILDKKQIINNYFEYLQDRMRLEISEIVKSNVFSKSINTLKCRHLFLERLGIFKSKSLKSKPNENNGNPRLHLIIDTTDKEFCHKICGVSLIEFESFIELLNKELAKYDNYNEYDSDDDFKDN